MKKNYGIYAIMLIMISTIMLVGCNKNDDIYNVSSEIVNDSQAHYGKVIRLSDFPKDKVLSIEYMDKVNQSITSNDVGGSPENALVALTFDKDLILYTSKRFNDDLANGRLIEITEYLTDIQTFHKVTGLKEATEEYSQFVNNAKGEKIWVFDTYVKFFEEKKEKSARLENKLNELKTMSSLKSATSIPNGRFKRLKHLLLI